ncbi:MAG TPA: glycine/sarcosine/betaine reductase selenoprotein B family protein [Thermoanaerobaculia bacterium]
MAETRELPLWVRTYLLAYKWRQIDPVPWAQPRKRLQDMKVALVSTAGMVLPGQAPFDDDVKGGDWSYREIPTDTDPRTLIETHRSKSFDHAGIQSDPNLGFPLDRLRELQSEGHLGALNHRHFSFMGSITAPGRLMQETAPAVAEKLVADGVDAVLLVPV